MAKPLELITVDILVRVTIDPNLDRVSRAEIAPAECQTHPINGKPREYALAYESLVDQAEAELAHHLEHLEP